MKKIILTPLICSLLFQCGTILKKIDTSKTLTNGEDVFYRDSYGKEGIYNNQAKNEWSAFSYGMYYKNLGMENLNNKEGDKYFTEAIKYLLESISTGIALENGYLQLSECYFYQKNYEKSLEYSRKSIEIDKNNLMSYNRIFNIYTALDNHQMAIETYEEYLKINPTAIYIQYIVAENYYKKLNNNKKAEEAFNKVINISKKTSVEDFYIENAYYSLGYLAFKAKENDNSIQFFKKVRELNINNINAAYMLALLYMDVYDLGNSEEYARIYLNKIPDNLVMNSIMGRISYIKGGRDTLSYLKAVKDSKTIEGLLTSGLYYEILRKDEEAEKFLRAMIKYKPDFLSPHLALAKIEMRKNNEKAAFNEYSTAGVLAFKSKLYEISRDCFNEAVKLNNSVPEIYFYLGRSYEELDYISLAILNYKKVDELKPGIEIALHIGYLYGKKENIKSSFKYFDRAIELEPGNAKPYFLKGLSFLKSNNFENAELNIKKAISLNDKIENYHFYLAIVFEKQNKFDQAVKSLEKAIEFDPKSARAYNYLGYLYADKNILIDKSFSLIQKALEIEPKNGAYLDSMGWVYYRKGEYKLALQKLLEAEKELNSMNSPDPVVYDHIGDALEKIGDLKNALYYWKKSVEMKKDAKIEDKIKKYDKQRD